MKLTGIIEDVFNGVTIFRGYATLKSLARLSKANGYQRERDEKRFDDIKEYMTSSPFVFFPELIFGWQIEDGQIIKQIKEGEETSNIVTSDNIKFKKNKFKFKPIAETEEPKTKVLTIDIPDNIGKPIFSRIDGNHRLSVVDSLLDDDFNPLLHKIVPYSIIIQTRNIESYKYEAAYFYLINSKAKPLTSNENLHAIIDAEAFTDTEKESLLSLDANQINLLEKIITQIKENGIDFIRNEFQNEIYSFSLILTTSLFDQADVLVGEDKLKNILGAIKYVNSIYLKDEVRCPHRNILLSMVMQKYRNVASFDKFLEWVNKNELGNIEHLSSDNIVRVFENIHKQKSYQVFVAMPYISHKRVNDFNKLFKEVLEEISKKIGFGLELIPIMRFRGASQRIDKRLIEKIKECDIFIGDLTTCNDNVIFEIGLAEGNGKKILLIKAEEDTMKMPFDMAVGLDRGKIIPFDMDKLQYIPYSSSGYYNDIKSILRNNIPVIVEQLKEKEV